MEEGAVIKHNIAKAPRTGDWKYMRPEVDRGKCVGCGTCVSFCPEATMSVVDEQGTKIGKKAEIDYEWCKGCGVCANVCPAKAITMRKNNQNRMDLPAGRQV